MKMKYLSIILTVLAVVSFTSLPVDAGDGDVYKTRCEVVYGGVWDKVSKTCNTDSALMTQNDVFANCKVTGENSVECKHNKGQIKQRPDSFRSVLTLSDGDLTPTYACVDGLIHINGNRTLLEAARICLSGTEYWMVCDGNTSKWHRQPESSACAWW